MTISTELNRITYTGNGATTAFAFPYKFFEDSDLEVYVDDVLQVITTNYTVSGAGLDAGGTVTFVTPPANLAEIVIVRVLPFTQELDYVEGDPFPAESHEEALDRAAMRDIQLKEANERSLRLSPTDTSGADTELPDLTAGYYLAATTAGDGFEWVSGVPAATTVSETQTSGTSQTVFTLTTAVYAPGSNNLTVYVDGVYQNSSQYVETSSTVVTFGTAVPDGIPVTFIVNVRDVATGVTLGTNVTYQYNNDADTRTVTSRLQDSVSVLDFGAAGDDTDQTTEIQAALDSGAGEVLFPAGNYKVTTALAPSSNQRLVGQKGAVLKQAATDINIIELDDLTGVEITGIKFDGDGFGTTSGNIPNVAVNSDDAAGVFKDCHIHHCEFTDMFNGAVRFGGAGAMDYSSGVWVHDNYCHSMNDECFQAFRMNKVEWVNNIVDNHAKECFKVSTADEVLIQGNKVHAAATGATDGPLINVGTDCNKVQIIGNLCYQGNKGIGIEKRVDGIVVAGNLCYDNGEQGIAVASSAGDTAPMLNITITGNHVLNSGDACISVVGISGQEAENITITGNVCKTSGGASSGILVDQFVSATVTGNHVEGADKNGIDVGTGTYITINSNVIADADEHGIDLNAVTYATVNSNIVTDPSEASAGSNGIEITSSCTAVNASNNICRDTGSKMFRGVNNQATTGTVSGNYVTGQTGDALRLATGGGQNDSVSNPDTMKVAQSGSAGFPSIAFISDANNGWYLAGTDNIAYSRAGALHHTHNATGTIIEAKVIGKTGIGADNSASATTPGSVTKKLEVFNSAGTSLGFVAIYDSIT